ncbi:MAG: amino acid permease [Holophaga sp.]|jgi:amino acid efflux transporter
MDRELAGFPGSLPETSAPRPREASGLRKAITVRHAVALYVSSVLGSGILVLPGLAAKVAGPASLAAWALLALGSYPFACTFAGLSARRPESGGIYGFTREAFGARVATVTAWLFLLWHVTGAPAVTLIAASYLGYAFPLGRPAVALIASGVILGTYAANLRGIVFSARVQTAVVAAIVALLAAAVAMSAGSVQAGNFRPFLPHGPLSVGTAAALIFWSFLGYENVSNVAEEFRDPRRDFRRSILASVVLVGSLYLAVAFVTVGTRAQEAGGSVAPFAAIFSHVLGRHGAAGTALLAVLIIFSTVNAYTAGMARVVLAAARDGGMPAALGRVDPRTGVPARSLTLLSILAMAMLLVYEATGIDLQAALLIPSGGAILIYVIGSAAGIRLLPGTGLRRLMPWASLALSAAVFPFVGAWALAAVLLAGAAWCWPRRA